MFVLFSSLFWKISFSLQKEEDARKQKKTKKKENDRKLGPSFEPQEGLLGQVMTLQHKLHAQNMLASYPVIRHELPSENVTQNNLPRMFLYFLVEPLSLQELYSCVIEGCGDLRLFHVELR